MSDPPIRKDVKCITQQRVVGILWRTFLQVVWKRVVVLQLMVLAVLKMAVRFH